MATRKRKTKRKTTKRKGGTTMGRTPAATRLTAKKRAKFLRTLEQTGNVSEAAKAIGASRQGIYKARDGDATFASAWESSLEIASDTLIAEVRRRGFTGIKEPLHYQGMLTGHVIRKYSDTLLIFLVKGLRPEFRDKLIENKIMTGPNATVVFESNGREVVDA